MKRKKHNWKEADRYLGKWTDREVADKFNIPRQLVANRRIGRGIYVATKWEKYEHLLGTMPDTDLAAIMNTRQNTVSVKRLRMKIPRFNPGPEMVVESTFCSTIKEPFERQVTTTLGRIDILTPTTIFECKYLLRLCEMHKAIGQLSCFGSIFPDRNKGIVCAEIKIRDDALAFLAASGITVIQIECEI